MSKKMLVAACFLFLAGFLAYAIDSQAMPNFARKYNADCTMCHTNVPQLNRTGYEFRAAGYRLPSEIGKEEKPFNLGDFFTARIQQQYTYTKHEDVNSTKDKTNSGQLEFFEFTMYPLSGSWGKNFASLTEFSMTPDDVFEIENAYVRGVMGDENGWFQARAGVMHPWEGFGASDRPVGNTRPLFQKSTAIGSPFFLWNLDEEAIEAGYVFAKAGTTVSARVSNGVIWKEDDKGAAEPAQGGGLSKPDGIGQSNKNYQIFVNQFITDDAAVSLFYYRGYIPFVDPNNAAAATGNTIDTFDRLALYANYWAVPRTVNLVAGYETGKDSLDNAGNVTTWTDASGKAHNPAQVGKNNGYFGEVDFHASQKLALAARYDSFDPSDKVGHNTQTAWTVSGNYYIDHGLQLIADYQEKDTEQTAGGSNKDKALTARLIFIW